MNGYTAYAIAFCAGLAATVYLVVNGHPGWAFGCLLITGCLEVRKSEK